MKYITVAMAALILALPVLAGSEDARNPFAGWEESRITDHRRRSRTRIAKKAADWLGARPGLVVQCRTCRGRGTIEKTYGRKPHSRRWKDDCALCNATGAVVDTSRYYVLFWEHYRPDFRLAPGRKQALDNGLLKAEENPVRELGKLARVTRVNRDDIVVEGNFATLTFHEFAAGKRIKRSVEWIEERGDWWLAHETGDRNLPRWRYADSSHAGEPKVDAPTPDEPGPSKKPMADAPTPAESGTSKMPEVLDAATYLEVGPATIKHAEENAYKVFGRVTNIAKDRRVAFVTIEVSLFLKGKLIDTTTCNVGNVIIKPGESVTYQGYLYTDAKPDYDRVEAKVSRFELMD